MRTQRQRIRRRTRRQRGGLFQGALDLYERTFKRPLPAQKTAKHDTDEDFHFDSEQAKYQRQREEDANKIGFKLNPEDRRNKFAEWERGKNSLSFKPLVLPRNMLKRRYQAISSDCRPSGNPVE